MTYHLFQKDWVSARKPHRCIWCGHRIAQNEIYLRERSVFDGTHQNHAWHWDCWFDAQENYFRYKTEFSPGDNERPEMLPFRCMEAWTAELRNTP